MTTRGFIEFVTSRTELRQSLNLHKTRVLMDGHMLQRRLYQLASGRSKDFKFCSDYASFAECIKRFLRRLKICDIVPIVVFHGAIDPKSYSDAFGDRISEISKIFRDNYQNVRFQSPTLCNYVFSSVMREFKVDVIQTCSSTWPQVAMLANALQCPVFSYRKDFFFLELKFGLLFDDSFLKSRLRYDESGHFWYLSTQVLRLNNLSATYQGLKPEVLPLLGTVWDRSLKFQVSESVYKRLLEKMHKCKTMDDILHWIKGKSVEKALEEMTECLKECEERNEGVDVKIKNLMKRFDATDSLLSQYLSDSEADKDSLRMMAKGDNEVVVPNWFAREYRKAVIRPAIMNIVKHKTHVLYPQLEDFGQSSSFKCTLELRCFLYGILRTDQDNPAEVKVLDRSGISKSVEMIRPLTIEAEGKPMPYLANIRQLPIRERRDLLLLVLEVTEAFINRCKVSLIMSDFFERISELNGTIYLIIILRYCIRNNPEQDWRPFISSFILAVMFYGNRELTNDQEWQRLRKIDHKKKFYPEVVHHFAQLQACLHMSTFINTILGFPLDEGKAYFCMDGVFLYNATRSQSDRRQADRLLDVLFEDRKAMVDVYEEMFQMVVVELNV